ncbi:MAG: hypothetical protein Q9174_005031, partial [Haloplaca sp. 1 TL-2023]
LVNDVKAHSRLDELFAPPRLGYRLSVIVPGQSASNEKPVDEAFVGRVDRLKEKLKRRVRDDVTRCQALAAIPLERRRLRNSFETVPEFLRQDRNALQPGLRNLRQTPIFAHHAYKSIVILTQTFGHMFNQANMDTHCGLADVGNLYTGNQWTQASQFFFIANHEISPEIESLLCGQLEIVQGTQSILSRGAGVPCNLVFSLVATMAPFRLHMKRKTSPSSSTAASESRKKPFTKVESKAPTALESRQRRIEYLEKNYGPTPAGLLTSLDFTLCITGALKYLHNEKQQVFSVFRECSVFREWVRNSPSFPPYERYVWAEKDGGGEDLVTVMKLERHLMEDCRDPECFERHRKALESGNAADAGYSPSVKRRTLAVALQGDFLSGKGMASLYSTLRFQIGDTRGLSENDIISAFEIALCSYTCMDDDKARQAKFYTQEPRSVQAKSKKNEKISAFISALQAHLGAWASVSKRSPSKEPEITTTVPPAQEPQSVRPEVAEDNSDQPAAPDSEMMEEQLDSAGDDSEQSAISDSESYGEPQLVQLEPEGNDSDQSAVSDSDIHEEPQSVLLESGKEDEGEDEREDEGEDQADDRADDEGDDRGDESDQSAVADPKMYDFRCGSDTRMVSEEVYNRLSTSPELQRLKHEVEQAEAKLKAQQEVIRRLSEKWEAQCQEAKELEGKIAYEMAQIQATMAEYDAAGILPRVRPATARDLQSLPILPAQSVFMPTIWNFRTINLAFGFPILMSTSTQLHLALRSDPGSLSPLDDIADMFVWLNYLFDLLGAVGVPDWAMLPSLTTSIWLIGGFEWLPAGGCSPVPLLLNGGQLLIMCLMELLNGGQWLIMSVMDNEDASIGVVALGFFLWLGFLGLIVL